MKRSKFYLPVCGLLLAGQMAVAAQASPPAAPTRADAFSAPAAVDVAGQTLQLNGQGSHSQAGLSVYDASLYLRQPVRDAQAFLALDGPKRLHLVARRDISVSELGRMMLSGVSNHGRRGLAMQHLAGLAQLGEMFGRRRKIAAGESVDLEHWPLVGTLLLVNGKVVGSPVRDPGLFDLLMSTWLGPEPVDEQLKAELLGLQGEQDLLARVQP